MAYHDEEPMGRPAEHVQMNTTLEQLVNKRQDAENEVNGINEQMEQLEMRKRELVSVLEAIIPAIEALVPTKAPIPPSLSDPYLSQAGLNR